MAQIRAHPEATARLEPAAEGVQLPWSRVHAVHVAALVTGAQVLHC